MTRNEKRNSRSRTRIGVIVVLGLLVVLVGGYTIRSTYYAQRFLPIERLPVSYRTHLS